MKTYPAQPLDLMQFINTKYHDPFIHAWIEFETAPDAKRLAQAIDWLAGSFPLLKCRYEESSNTFLEKEAFSGGDLLRIDDSASREALLTEALPMSDRLVQFTLAGNSLCVTISHLLCDGGGFKQLLYLLCSAYNGLPEADTGYLMRRGFAQLLDEHTNRAAITLKMLLSVLGSYKSKPVYARADCEAPYVLERIVPQTLMAKVHSRAKQQGATLNDVFLTAYARALGRLYQLEKVGIPCTVDLRKYAKDKTGIANLTGSYNLNLRLRSGAAFAETLADTSRRMKKQKGTQNDLAGPMLLVSKYEKSSLEQFLKLYGGMDTSPSADYTNLGILDAQRLVFEGAAVKNAVIYSGLSKAPYSQLEVSTYQGEATVASLVQCSEAEKAKADRILDAVVEELSAFAGAAEASPA